MVRTHSSGRPAALGEPVLVLAAYDEGVAAICGLAERIEAEGLWDAQTPCPEWRAADLAGHLRCIADDFHEYLDEAPVSRYARLLATGAHADTLSRKLARQNAAELVALADAPPLEHIAAFAQSARSYAIRMPAVWDLPHHQYRDTVVTVAGMAGAACVEWHLHAWDLAQAVGADYRPADPAAVLDCWRRGMPQLPPVLRTGWLGGLGARHIDPWHAVLAASGRPAGAGRVRSGPGPTRARLARLRRHGRETQKACTST
jgi:Mycothiol maleylpyruvate isomerase N-terminal domain